MCRKIFSFSALVLLLLTVFGCSETQAPTGWQKPAIDAGAPGVARRARGGIVGTVQPVAQRLPWELWVYGQGTAGEQLVHPTLYRSDELCREGDRAQALTELRTLRVDQLNPNDQGALALRQAGLELSQAAPATALQTLTNHVRRRNLAVEDVDVRLSLLFGYAYRATRDTEQALAWFTRAGTLAQKGPLFDAAKGGIGGVLRREPVESLSRLEEQWGADGLVAEELRLEQTRRSQGGIVETGDLSSTSAAIPSAAPGQRTIVLLLPLTGRFGALGQSVQHGIMVALEGQGLLADLNVVVHDTGDDALDAAGFLEGFSKSDPPIILGPLIAEHTPKVADVVHRKGATMVSFSKRTELELGQGIFRLGATVRSQIDSLLEEAHTRLLLERFAVVYPRDQAGQEYADAFRTKLRDLGLTAVYEGSYSRDNLDDLLPIAQELEKTSVDAVFIPDTIVVASRFLNNLSGRARSRIRPLGLGLWDSERDLKTSQQALDGAVLVSPFYEQTPAGREFVASYQSRFAQHPDFLAAQGFDAATLVSLAIVSSRTSPEQSMEESLIRLDPYVGLTGVIRVGPDGEMLRDYRVVEFKDGQLRPLGVDETAVPNPAVEAPTPSEGKAA